MALLPRFGCSSLAISNDLHLDLLSDDCQCIHGDCEKDTGGNNVCKCHEDYKGLQCEEKLEGMKFEYVRRSL